MEAVEGFGAVAAVEDEAAKSLLDLLQEFTKELFNRASKPAQIVIVVVVLGILALIIYCVWSRKGRDGDIPPTPNCVGQNNPQNIIQFYFCPTSPHGDGIEMTSIPPAHGPGVRIVEEGEGEAPIQMRDAGFMRLGAGFMRLGAPPPGFMRLSDGTSASSTDNGNASMDGDIQDDAQVRRHLENPSPQ